MDHDHLPALTFLMFAAPLAVLALAIMRPSGKHGSRDEIVGLGLFIAGVIHVGLVPGHVDEPLLAASLGLAGGAMLILAVATVTTSWWRTPSALCLGFVLAAYVATRITGFEGLDALGVATCAIEVLSLALLLLPRRREPDQMTEADQAAV